MPAAVTDNWQAVQDTAVALNSIKLAADKHGVPYKAAKMRASREKWPVGHRPAKLLAEMRHAHSVAVTLANSSAVTNVTTTAQAVSDTVATNKNRSLTALSSATAKVAEAMDKLKDGNKIDAERLLKAASAHAKLHPTQETGRVNVNIYGDGRSAGDVIEVESEVVTD